MDEKEQNDKEDATFGELKGLAVILKSGNEEESSNNKKSNDVLAWGHFVLIFLRVNRCMSLFLKFKLSVPFRDSGR